MYRPFFALDPFVPSPDLHLFDLSPFDLSDHLQISSSFTSFLNFHERSETELAINALSRRVSALELGLGLGFGRASEKLDKTTSWTVEYKGLRELGLDRKYKWVTESKGSGERKAKWIAEIKGAEGEGDGGVDRKYRWVAEAKRNGVGNVKWSAEYRGKGRYAPVSRTYSWQSSLAPAVEDESDVEDEVERKKDKEKKKKSRKGKSVQLVEIEEKVPSRATVAIRKAFATSYRKGKKKELSPHDAALLIQRAYRTHLVRRAQVLRCLRSLAVAKTKLKELRALFCNFHYRNRIAKDAEERQRFSEKIIVLLLTVDSIEGPDYLVRVAKKSMIEELEAMLEVVDPQPAGKLSSMRRRKFDLPEGPISREMMAGVAEVVQMLNEE